MTKLCPRGKAAAKRKFAVYPSAYANAYASKICAGKIKDPSGKKRKDFKGPKPAGKVVGGVISTVGKALGKKGIKYLKSPEGRKKTKEIMDSPLPKKMKETLGKLKKAGFNKGGGADTGRRGEFNSKLGVAINKIKRNRPTRPDIKKIKQKFQSEKDLPRSMKIDTTTSAYGDAGKGRPVPKYKSGGINKDIIEKAKEFRKKSKQKKQKKGFELKYPGPARPGNPVVVYEVKKGGLTSELNNPAKGYTKGGMADYYKDLM
jgi:hypothetical protein